MASDGDSDEKSQAPGIGMKLTVAGICQKFSTVKNISTGRLSNWMKQTWSHTESQGDKDHTEAGGLVILDARPPEEYVIGHIAGSVRVNYKAEPEEIIADIPQLQEAGPTKVVCYCSVGFRSSMVAQKLEHMFNKQGTTDQKSVYNLWGSLFQWANEGRPMTDGNNQPTIYAHPYSAVFGKLLKKELRRTELPKL